MTSSPRAGFTLVELLVVIAIIGVLAGLGSKMVGFAIKSSSIGLAEQEMQRLVLGVETYQLDFGDYPPSSMEKEYEISGNGLDEGNESLVAHLASRSRGRSYFEFKEEFLENLDQDHLRNADLYQQMRWVFGDDQLREYVDPWGVPYVYMHNRDYGIEYSVTQETGPVKIQAGTSLKTATFHEPLRFQIWSAGPDGIHQMHSDEAADSDDVAPW
ncbi:MAG TPA: prepilin-type N-terminal cleavage/methylation domain-containing protein [Planctomycetes bacterium]|nr:prepilin-type N-terminal cleavage/methylation domain-containing protein [Planctomycetota bacterium]HIK82416.1 prepilin-type N-terminal cleavage/methylation domain-containing protein [Planctomycetota bacterium]